MAETQTVDQDFLAETAEGLVSDAAEPQNQAREGDSPSETPETAETASEGLTDVDMTPDVPEEILRDIEMDELDLDEPEPEPEMLELPPEQEWEDDDTKKLRAELRKAQKRMQWLESQNARTGRKVWAEEARKYFPLAEGSLDSIEATSKRAFLRRAKEIHETILPSYRAMQEKLESRLSAEREKAKAEAREEVEKAWGNPTVVGDTSGPDIANLGDRKMQFRTHQKPSLVDQISRRFTGRQ